MAKQIAEKQSTRRALKSFPLRIRRAAKDAELAKEAKLPPESEFIRFLSGNSSEAAAQVLELIFRYGQLHGSKEQAWIIDQTVRQLTGEHYAAFIEAYSFDEEFGHSYSWDQGVAPSQMAL